MTPKFIKKKKKKKSQDPPKIVIFSETPPKNDIRNFEPPKIGLAYVARKYQSPPPPHIHPQDPEISCCFNSHNDAPQVAQGNVSSTEVSLLLR